MENYYYGNLCRAISRFKIYGNLSRIKLKIDRNFSDPVFITNLKYFYKNLAH